MPLVHLCTFILFHFFACALFNLPCFFTCLFSSLGNMQSYLICYFYWNCDLIVYLFWPAPLTILPNITKKKKKKKKKEVNWIPDLSIEVYLCIYIIYKDIFCVLKWRFVVYYLWSFRCYSECEVTFDVIKFNLHFFKYQSSSNLVKVSHITFTQFSIRPLVWFW